MTQERVPFVRVIDKESETLRKPASENGEIVKAP
jgi:hypothetical protein